MSFAIFALPSKCHDPPVCLLFSGVAFLTFLWLSIVLLRAGGPDFTGVFPNTLWYTRIKK